VTVPEVLPPRRLAPGEALAWDDSADTVVVGLGAAGACAAIEAAERGADVLALDRLIGGGDTAFSGGAVYAGGGTEAQKAAGFEDSADNMYDYLRREVDGAVDDDTLRRFCAGSLDDVRWLERHGVRFGRAFWPDKTPFPPNGYHLFYSGSEACAPFNETATPVPRAHKTDAPGMGAGSVFFAALVAAAERAGVRIRRQTAVRRLVLDASGRVVGVEARAFRDGAAARLHRALARLAIAIPAAVSIGPHLPAIYAGLRALEKRFARKIVLVEARRGVVLATGGYQHNRELLAEHAPYAAPLMAIGFDASGSAVRLGEGVGADTGYLDNVGVFKMFVPPLAFGRGMLVDARGERFTNEMYYSGRVGRAMRSRPDRPGKAWLVLDAELAAEARAELPRLPLFSSAPARLSLARAVRADTLDELAGKLGLPAGAVRHAAAEVAATAGGATDRFGTSAAASAVPRRAPFLALDMSLDAKPVPATMFSVGGLRVDGSTGAVLAGGEPIPGLYAAGRAAVGLCSNSYVSGLSLADCVFSGRRAGAAVS
jgi:3-oxo-5alpha-steroid 4-dehydrogenase